jgi:uncharacterized membrane protein
MVWLVIGVAIWSGVHLLRGIAPEIRLRLVGAIGEGPYKGIFSLLLIAGIVVTVLGWRAVVPAPVYEPPSWGPAVTGNLMIIGMILIFGGRYSSLISRNIRHPMLIGVAVWSLAHLFANGDDRSLILFGGIGLWSVAEITLINRRDGAWQAPERKSLRTEIRPLAIGLAGYAIMVFAHEFLFGVTPLSS